MKYHSKHVCIILHVERTYTACINIDNSIIFCNNLKKKSRSRCNILRTNKKKTNITTFFFSYFLTLISLLRKNTLLVEWMAKINKKKIHWNSHYIMSCEAKLYELEMKQGTKKNSLFIKWTTTKIKSRTA